MFCFPVQQFVLTTILTSVFQNPYTPLITMEMHPMTINAMDMNTMVNMVRDAFEGQDRHNPQLNPAFGIVHFLLGQASEKITKTIFPSYRSRTGTRGSTWKCNSLRNSSSISWP
jgi:hypothetical protein